MLENYQQIIDKYSRKLVLDNPTMDIEASTNKLIKAIKNASVFARLKMILKLKELTMINTT